MLSKNGLWFFVALFLFALLGFVLIANPAHYYFLNDDFIHIPLAAQKKFIRSGLIRPLSDFSLWLDYTFWNENAFGYHLTNMLLHVANSVLVFFACRSLFGCFEDRSGHEVLKKSAFAATLFLMYAFHSESVFWIIGRGGSLCTLFFLLSFIFYLKSGNTVLNYVISLCCFFIGLLAYETIWIFPLVVSTMYVFGLKRNIRHVVGVWLVFLFYLSLRLYIAPVSSGDYQFGAFNNHDYFHVFYNYNTLLARCFLPPMQNSILFFCAYIIVASILVFFCVKWWKDRLLLFSITCLLLSLLPVTTLGIDTHDSESERFIYLASFFAVFSLIQILSKLKPPFFYLAFAVILVAHTYLLYKTAGTYKASSTIAKQSLQCIPANIKFNTIYAVNLPTQYKGALIFRTGFVEAVNWIRQTKSDSIEIISTKEIDTPNTTSCFDSIAVGNASLMPIKDTLLNAMPAQMRAGDVVISWNGDSLNIIRKPFNMLSNFEELYFLAL